MATYKDFLKKVKYPRKEMPYIETLFLRIQNGDTVPVKTTSGTKNVILQYDTAAKLIEESYKRKAPPATISNLAKIQKIEIKNKGIKINFFTIDIENDPIWQGNQQPKKPKEPRASSNRGGITTAAHETLTCYFILAYYQHRSNNVNFYTQEIMERFSNRVKSDVSLDTIYTILTEDWFESCLQHAKKLNELHLVPPSAIVIIDNYGESLAFNRAIKEELNAQGDIIPQNTNINKWNTADIWIAKSSTRLLSYATGNIFSTNAKLVEAFKKKELIGVSLKKIAGKTAKHEYNNIDDHVAVKSEYNIRSVRVTTSSKAFTSLSGYYLFTDGSDIHCNMKTAQSNWNKIRFDANIPNSAAGAGGAADTQVFHLAKKSRIIIPSELELERFSKSVWNKEESSIEALYQMIYSFDKTYKKETLNQELNSGEEHYIRKKTAIIYHLYKMMNDNSVHSVNTFLSKLMALIMAKSEWSGPFVKIY